MRRIRAGGYGSIEGTRLWRMAAHIKRHGVDMMTMQTASTRQSSAYLAQVATALTDIAGLTLRALSKAEPQLPEIAGALLNRVMWLCEATQGALVIEETPAGSARQRVRPLALKALTIHEADALLTTLGDTPAHVQQDASGERQWLRFELPLQGATSATSAASVSSADGQELRVLVLLGWSAHVSTPTVKRASARLQAVAEAAGAVVAALRLSQPQDGANEDESAATVSGDGAAAGTGGAWEQIFDAVSDPMCVVSADYRLERANAAYIKLFGLNRHGIPGHECYAHLQGQTGPCANCPLPHTVQTRTAAFVQQERLVPTSGGAFERRTF